MILFIVLWIKPEKIVCKAKKKWNKSCRNMVCCNSVIWNAQKPPQERLQTIVKTPCFPHVTCLKNNKPYCLKNIRHYLKNV